MNKPLLLLACLSLAACVPQGKYDRAVATTETTRAELQKKNAELQKQNAELQKQNGVLLTAQMDLAEQRSEAARLKALIASLEEQDRTRSGEHAATRSRIADLQKRLGELEAAERAADARAALYRDLSVRLRKQIDDGDLALVVRDGRMVLQLPNDVLFDSGRTELKPAGREALKAVAAVMKTMPSRQFQVSGHTDNVPIHNDRFPSNWELSTGRALRVVHFLIGEGADATVLSAAGYSDVDPVASNATPAERKKNRRTEITLQPNIDELVKIP